jgi:hypothetical protein
MSITVMEQDIPAIINAPQQHLIHPERLTSSGIEQVSRPLLPSNKKVLAS